MERKYSKFKVAAVQAAPVYLDLEKTVDKVVKFIDEAGQKILSRRKKNQIKQSKA